MNSVLTLADLTRRTGMDVLGHLEREAAIPVVDGLQAQGDLIVVPLAMLPQVTIRAAAAWRWVPEAGVEVVRGVAGGNPHTLVADPRTCQWTTQLTDRDGLAVGALRAAAPVYLVHPEHGGTGIAPGTYVIRRQRERRGPGSDAVRGAGFAPARDVFVAD
ncbi:hypothetical protein Acsp04_51870 [Actinomadura sp. NBRC 104425]|uniref:hypothetical protein n=1 Tax=Actinomadura sp. NBRC 104425 TaxID=3032204 RepID=UPI0024A03217|nr:hypothetical protein [Actinomadura sp. NBRC 104425]GLZ14952.1 hypothetical protein Acsp04_51870 [Actinomadura sp. NBRC 104425]